MSVDSRVPSCGNIFSSPFPIFSWSFKSDHVSHKYGVYSARRPDGASSVPKLKRTGNCFDRTPKANGRMKMHIAIVGAGPGGLAAAINLASTGVRVTVVEKDPIPGGRMKGLTLGERNEYSVDSGPTLMHVPEILMKLFSRAGKRIEDYVTLMPLHHNTRVRLWDGMFLDTFFQDQPRMEE